MTTYAVMNGERKCIKVKTDDALDRYTEMH